MNLRSYNPPTQSKRKQVQVDITFHRPRLENTHFVILAVTNPGKKNCDLSGILITDIRDGKRDRVFYRLMTK